MQIAAQHAEAVRERSGVGVEERLFLDRIALHATDVAPGHHQASAPVEPHFAHAGRAVRNLAVMPAGVAVHPAVVAFIVEIAFAHVALERLS